MIVLLFWLQDMVTPYVMFCCHMFFDHFCGKTMSSIVICVSPLISFIPKGAQTAAIAIEINNHRMWSSAGLDIIVCLHSTVYKR